MNTRLPRWIKASVSNYFTTALSPVPLFITGDLRTTEQDPNWIELRFNGPDFMQNSKDTLRMMLRLNFVVNLVSDGKNSYAMEDYTGLIASLIVAIPIYRYGDVTLDPQDDSSFIQCIEPMTEGTHSIEIKNFGKLDPSTNLTQSTVEVTYKSYFGDI